VGSFRTIVEVQSISDHCQQYECTYVCVYSVWCYCPILTNFGVTGQIFEKLPMWNCSTNCPVKAQRYRRRDDDVKRPFSVSVRKRLKW